MRSPPLGILAVVLSGACWLLLTGSTATCLCASEEVAYTFGAHYDSMCLATVSAAIQLEHAEDLASFVQVTPGLRGGKVSIGCGYDEACGVCGPVKGSWVNAFILAGKLTYLRVWDPPHRFESQRNFLGIEMEGALVLGGTIGVFRSLNPGRHGAAWTAAWSIGIGL
jgi:hypothetical protein